MHLYVAYYSLNCPGKSLLSILVPTTRLITNRTHEVRVAGRPWWAVEGSVQASPTTTKQPNHNQQQWSYSRISNTTHKTTTTMLFRTAVATCYSSLWQMPAQPAVAWIAAMHGRHCWDCRHQDTTIRLISSTTRTLMNREVSETDAIQVRHVKITIVVINLKRFFMVVLYFISVTVTSFLQELNTKAYAVILMMIRTSLL